MPQPLQVLIAEDNDSDAELMLLALEQGGFAVTARVVKDADSFKVALAERTWDLVISDYMMPGFGGAEALAYLRETGLDIPFIVVSGTIGEETAVGMMRAGADDYIMKDSLARLPAAVARELAIARTRRDHARAVAALRHSEERYRTTLASLAECVIATDVSGRVTLMNPAAETLTGWPEHEAAGQPLDQILRLVGGNQGAAPDSVWRAVLAGGPARDMPAGTILKSREGKSYAVAASASPIRGGAGEHLGVVIVFRDIGEEQMLRSEALKAQKLESLGVLAGGIAHDFNNVLVVIAGNLQMARAFPRQDEQHEALLRSAEAACLKASSLAQQLLTFAKGGAPIKQVTSLDGLVRDTALFALSGSNVSCHFAIEDELWSVEADAGQISQVISNLVINAGQAMPAGGSLQIALSNVVLPPGSSLPLAPGDYVAISVQDEGTGIPPEHLDRIFDPYFTTKEKGSGLGLATCYSVVRNHGGYIHVSSALGVGSIFTVYLPARRDASQGEFVRGEEIPRGTGRILVMDDDEDVLQIAVMFLEELGYEVTGVPHGEQAIAAYQKAQQAGQPFAAVMLDLTVRSGLGGQETLQRLRELDPQVRAVVCSGYSADPVMAFYSEYGFRGVVVKPYAIADLAKAIRAAVAPDATTSQSSP